MAQYRVIQASFINGRYRESGTVIEYDGVPGFNLEPLDDEAMAAKKAVGFTGTRDVNGREFQEDLTRTDGTPSEVIPRSQARQKTDTNTNPPITPLDKISIQKTSSKKAKES